MPKNAKMEKKVFHNYRDIALIGTLEKEGVKNNLYRAFIFKQNNYCFY